MSVLDKIKRGGYAVHTPDVAIVEDKVPPEVVELVRALRRAREDERRLKLIEFQEDVMEETNIPPELREPVCTFIWKLNSRGYTEFYYHAIAIAEIISLAMDLARKDKSNVPRT